jgi:hypothetical protein
LLLLYTKPVLRTGARFNRKAAIMPASPGAPPAPAGIVEMGHAARA